MTAFDVTSAFQGFSTPITELYDDIHRRGWTVTDVKVKDGQYIAEGKSLHGEKVTAAGRTDATAVGNLLMKVMRKEYMRASSLREKLGAWDHKPIESQLQVIAMAYQEAPVYDPTAASAWMELAQDCSRRVATIRTQVTIEYTDDPVPYQTADEMREDIQKKHHLLVTRANSHHPVWNQQQMLDYRTVVDVLGHTVGGADWGWHGTCLAFAALAPLMAEVPQKALFTELIGQTAYGSVYRMWGPQKISFLDDLIEKAQEQENKPGHSGVHPSQSLIPGQIPQIQSFGKVAAETRNQMLQRAAQLPEDQSQVVHEFPDGWTMRALQTYGDMHREGQLMSNCFSPVDQMGQQHWTHEAWNEYPHTLNNEGYDPEDDRETGEGGIPPYDYSLLPEHLQEPLGQTMYSLRDPDNLPHASIDPHAEYDYQVALGRHNSELKPEHAKRIYDWANYELGYEQPDWEIANLKDTMDGIMDGLNYRESAVTGQQVDPNADWQSNVAPLPDNAFMWQRADGQDPLHIQGAQEALRGLEPGLTNMHPALAQQTVTNALRAALLGARKSPMAHAVHYQGVMHIPSSVGDPMAYRDALEQQREMWNQAKGYAPESHKQYWPEEQQFKQWVKAMNPQLDDAEVNREAQRELLHMLTEEEERITSRDQPEQLTAELIEHEAFEAIRRRLKAMTKPSVDQKVDFGDDHLFHEAALTPDHAKDFGWTGSYWHQAPTADRDRVRAHGLIPGTPRWSENWYETGKEPSGEIHPDQPTGVYLGAEPVFAMSGGRPFDLWKVDPAYVNSGMQDPHSMGSVVADHPIPPEALTLHTPWEANENAWAPLADQRRQDLQDQIQEKRDYEEMLENGNAYGIGQPTAKTATHHADMYPSYLVSQLKQLAHVSRHAKSLGEAALEDLREHRGRGHHFRSEAMAMGIPGLTPRHLSTAWLHLAPQTSQLGIIDPHVMETLGHDWLTDGSTRDYFKHERELAAGRDAAGYGHVPLGQFSAALWDNKVGGQDWHPDRTPLKAYMPTPYAQVDWNAQTPQAQNWADPYWWNSTQEARDEAGKDFDRGIAVNFNRNDVPWSTRYAMRYDLDGNIAPAYPLSPGAKAFPPNARYPWAILPGTDEKVQGTPGTSLMQHVKDTFGHNTAQDVWNQDYEVGKDAA